MKKAFAIFAVLMIGNTSLNAQSDNSVRLGIRLSPNMAWIRSDTKGLESDGNVIGYNFGLSVEFPFGANGNYRIATGLLLNNIGGKSATEYFAETNGVRTDFKSTSMTRLRYIDLPLTVKLMTNEIGYMRYFGQLGFDAGVNIRAKSNFETISTTNNVSTSSTLDDEDVKSDINPLKLGLVIGAGAEYNFSGSTSAMFGVLYHSSFTTLYKKEGIAGVDKPKTFADYIELMLGVYF